MLTDKQIEVIGSVFMAYRGYDAQAQSMEDWRPVYVETGSYIIRVLVVVDDLSPEDAADKVGDVLGSDVFQQMVDEEVQSIADREAASAVGGTLH